MDVTKGIQVAVAKADLIITTAAQWLPFIILLSVLFVLTFITLRELRQIGRLMEAEQIDGKGKTREKRRRR